MQSMKVALATAALLCSAQLWAETPQEARVKTLVEPRMGVGVKVDSVAKTAYGNMYEVRTNGDIFYTDETARYMFVGKVIDLNTMQDLTRKRVDEISGIRFSDLPLELAIKTVRGNGKRVMAVFEDPNCPFCRKLHQTMKGVDNVTIYTFLLNILSEDSAAKAKNIWCAANRSEAWERWMTESKLPPAAPAACATPHEQVIALGQKLRVAGTPTIYFADGSRAGSGFDLAAIEAKLNTAR